MKKKMVKKKNDDDELVNYLAWRGGESNTSNQPTSRH